MAKCEMRIVLDRPDQSYKGGEKITGRVEVTVKDECECRALTLTPEWRTHGKGNEDSSQEEPLTLFSGRWQSGQNVSYPFEFPAPYLPVSYRGTLFSVEWSLRARADVPGAIDPKAEVNFIILPGQRPPATVDDSDVEDLLDRMPQSISMQIPPAVGLAVASASFVLGLWLIWRFWGAVTTGAIKESHMWTLWGGAACLLFGSGGLWYALRHLILAKKLGAVDVELNSFVVRPDDTLTCKVRFRPHAEIDLTEAKLRLTAKEETVEGSGKNKRTKSATVHKEEVKLVSERRVMAEESVFLEGSFHLAPDAPLTFHGGSNSLEWKVEVRLNLRRLPDWKRDLAIDVSL